MIKVIKTNKSMMKDIPILKDTLIYTTDTHETFFDLNHIERLQIKTGVQFRDEDQIFSIANPNPNKLYISIKTNRVYRRFDNKFVEVKERAQLVDLLIGMKEMKPVVLTEQGKNIAPRTLMSQVYGEDGRTLDEILKDKERESYTFIYTKTVVLEAEYDYQKVFDIPFPIPNYDIKKFPIEVLFGDSEFVKPANYAISKSQLIFGNVFAERILKGNLITLIFHYSETVMHGDFINANLINGRYIIFAETEPMDMKIGDIWFNLKDKMALEYTSQGWVDILNPGSIDIIKDSVIISAEEMEIPITIRFDNKLDDIDVYRNGLLYTEGIDYNISEDNKNVQLLNENAFIIPNEMHTFTIKVTKNGLPREIGVDVVE